MKLCILDEQMKLFLEETFGNRFWSASFYLCNAGESEDPFKKLIGFAELFSNGCEVANLGALYIDPDFQNKGLGQTLLKFCTDYAYNKGCQNLHASMSGLGDQKRRKAFFVDNDFDSTNGYILKKPLLKSLVLNKAFSKVEIDQSSLSAEMNRILKVTRNQTAHTVED